MAGEWLAFFDQDDAADNEDPNLQTEFLHGDLAVDQIADLLIRAEIDPQLLSNDQLDRLLGTAGQLNVSANIVRGNVPFPVQRLTPHSLSRRVRDILAGGPGSASRAGRRDERAPRTAPAAPPEPEPPAPPPVPRAAIDSRTGKPRG